MQRLTNGCVTAAFELWWENVVQKQLGKDHPSLSEFVNASDAVDKGYTRPNDRTKT